MGPPTISADQGIGVVIISKPSCRFNGAADDLGGSRTIEQWRSSKSVMASMGPPTISADQGYRKRQLYPTYRSFNGAADDLGGSRMYCLPVGPMMRCFNGAADDLGGSRLRAARRFRDSWLLQWGRRRSRRIKSTPTHLVFATSSCFNGAADDLGGSSVCREDHHPDDAQRASMGPPTISADQGNQVRPLASGEPASMGPPTISADQGRKSCRECDRLFVASMGPPTISADQASGNMSNSAVLFWLQWGRRRSRRIKSTSPGPTMSERRGFNGAADDLGGSRQFTQNAMYQHQLLQWGRRRSRRIKAEDEPKKKRKASELQWGRRRSRRIKVIAESVEACAVLASMGPPTISADQVRTHKSARSTRWLQWGRRRSRRIKVELVDYILCSHRLQWGRRRSRRIKPGNLVKNLFLVQASMGPPTISADQDHLSDCPLPL